MSDLTFVAIIAFLLGLLAGLFLQPWRLRNWRWSIEQQLPKKCPVCGTWHQSKKMKYAKHRLYGWIDVCEPCYRALYNPFSKED